MTRALKTGPRGQAGQVDGRPAYLAPAIWALTFAAMFLGLACAGSDQWPAESPAQPGDPLAALAAAGEGGEVYLPDGPFGPGRAILGEKYLSALNQSCRRAIFITPTGQHRAAAICQEKNGRWALAPDIFMPVGNRF